MLSLRRDYVATVLFTLGALAVGVAVPAAAQADGASHGHEAPIAVAQSDHGRSVEIPAVGFAPTGGPTSRVLDFSALATIGASRGPMDSGQTPADSASHTLHDSGKLPAVEGPYESEWPEATMSSTAVNDSTDAHVKYAIKPTGLTCHASADQSTLDGSYGCYSLDASGQPQWQMTTTTFVAASAEVFDVDGSVVSFREAGLYIVSGDDIWPLDSLAARVIPGRTAIDEAMPLIDAEMSKYDQFPWLPVIASLTVAALFITGAVILVVVARRRRSALSTHGMESEIQPPGGDRA